MTPAFGTSSFTFGGHRLVYDDYGDGDRVVVYLHGLLIDSDLNRGIAEALAARGNRVILLDLVGHGRSDKPEHASAYRIDTYADQVFALADELRIERPVLGGMSLGANVSLFAASRRPDRVRGLVLEMPVLEWAVPPSALLFASLLLLLHYGRTPARWLTSLVRAIPSTPSAFVNGLLHGAALPPEVMAAILHGVLVGPVAPDLRRAGGDRRAGARARPRQRSHPSLRRRRQARGRAARCAAGTSPLPDRVALAARPIDRRHRHLHRGAVGSVRRHRGGRRRSGRLNPSAPRTTHARRWFEG